MLNWVGDRAVLRLRYAHFVSPMIEYLGGPSKANALYFEWLNRIGTPDYRDFFSSQVNGTRRVGAPGVYKLGEFLVHHIPWCNPLVMLYGADHLEAYVACMVGLARLGRFDSVLRRLAENVNGATQFLDLDTLVVRQALPFERGLKSESIGRLFVQGLGEDDWDFERDLHWFGSTEHWSADRRARYEARRQARSECMYQSPDLSESLDAIFEAWVFGRRATVGQAIVEPEFGGFAIAWTIARAKDLDPHLRRYGVDVFVGSYFASNSPPARARPAERAQKVT